ncbi:MAG: hypothetical protein ABEI06_00915 [Halobacteriaceae archaeon]
MVGTTFERQVNTIIFLLAIAVSLLSGLVFGDTTGQEIIFALGSFVVLGAVLLLASVIRQL